MRFLADVRHPRRLGLPAVLAASAGIALAARWGPPSAAGDEPPTVQARSGPSGAPMTHEPLVDVRSLSFAPDGKALASGSGGGLRQTGRLLVWDLADLRPRALVRTADDVPGRRIDAVAFAPDGKTLASSSVDSTVSLWDVAAGRTKASLHPGAPRPGDPTRLVFAPDGKTLAVAYSGAGAVHGAVALWDIPTQKVRALLRWPKDPSIQGVAFAPDGKTIAAAALYEPIRLWDVATGEPTGTLLGDGGRKQFPEDLAFSPDGATLAYLEGERIQLWDFAGRKVRAAVRVPPDDYLKALAFTPGGRTFVTVSLNSRLVRLWEAKDGRELDSAKLDGVEPHCLAISPDGRTLAVGGYLGDVDFGTIELLDLVGDKIRPARRIR